MSEFKNHLIPTKSSIKDALLRLDKLGRDAIIFVVDENDILLGSLTDGDIRRGLIKGITIHHSINEIIQSSPKFIRKGETTIEEIIKFRENNYRIIPIVDKNKKVTKIINFRELRSYLPLDAVIMAGGRGERLKPLTDATPKPLLKIGELPIIEHNLNRLSLFGIDDFWISVRYLGHQIENHFGEGEERNIKINYVWEDQPLGTIGSVGNISNFQHEYVLITNSDLLTNIDYEHFFLQFLKNDCEMAVATIPYQVSVPYAVLETQMDFVKSFKEKPIYTYYSNGGIYLIKRKVLELIPQNSFFNATDLMEKVIQTGGRILSYPITGYWLDIGNPEDYAKAQNDYSKIQF